MYDGEFICEIQNGDELSLKTVYTLGADYNKTFTLDVKISVTEV
jgi:hypothetical protein